jgi:tRNA threonylcarbamoyladenosine biosynthesis protein TsaB
MGDICHLLILINYKMGEYILNIDTASTRGLVMISQFDQRLSTRVNTHAFDHASFLQPAIKELMDELSIEKSEIRAIAVANGPGSYTGLRVGLAAAKGLCFAWQIPLITLSSLHIMAKAMQATLIDTTLREGKPIAFVPMIDARRMEVFFGMYTHFSLEAFITPNAAVIDENFLENELKNYTIFFSGDGADKWKAICKDKSARFIPLPEIDNAFAALSWQGFQRNYWADLAYCEPFYKKEFYTPVKL